MKIAPDNLMKEWLRKKKLSLLVLHRLDALGISNCVFLPILNRIDEYITAAFKFVALLGCSKLK